MIIPFHETKHGVLYCGDCLEVMEGFEDKSFDLTVTSPPYDNLREYGEGKGYCFTDSIFKPIANQIFRITKKGGVCVWVVGDATVNGSETGSSFRQALYFKQIGFNLHDTMIYEKKNIVLTHNRYEQCFEYMFVLSSDRPNVFNPIMIKTVHSGAIKKHNYGNITDAKLEKMNAKRHRDETTKVRDTMIKYNIWNYPCGFNGSTNYKQAFEHPAIFPEQLAIDHVKSWSNEGMTILDPFAGSGTTAIACIRTGRKYVLIEKEEKYCEIAAKRIETELDETDIFREER